YQAGDLVARPALGDGAEGVVHVRMGHLLAPAEPADLPAAATLRVGGGSGMRVAAKLVADLRRALRDRDGLQRREAEALGRLVLLRGDRGERGERGLPRRGRGGGRRAREEGDESGGRRKYCSSTSAQSA